MWWWRTIRKKKMGYVRNVSRWDAWRSRSFYHLAKNAHAVTSMPWSRAVKATKPCPQGTSSQIQFLKSRPTLPELLQLTNRNDVGELVRAERFTGELTEFVQRSEAIAGISHATIPSIQGTRRIGRTSVRAIKSCIYKRRSNNEQPSTDTMSFIFSAPKGRDDVTCTPNNYLKHLYMNRHLFANTIKLIYTTSQK